MKTGTPGNPLTTLGINVSPNVYHPRRKPNFIKRYIALIGLALFVCFLAGWLLIDVTSTPLIGKLFLSKDQQRIERWIQNIPTFNPDTDKIIKWFPPRKINAKDKRHSGADCVIRVKFRCSSMFGPMNHDNLFFMQNGKIDTMETAMFSMFEEKDNMFKLYFPEDFDY
jgi:hypothetical protein